jgi:hypothetical protein
MRARAPQRAAITLRGDYRAGEQARQKGRPVALHGSPAPLKSFVFGDLRAVVVVIYCK